jgi:hypothetical protein
VGGPPGKVARAGAPVISGSDSRRRRRPMMRALECVPFGPMSGASASEGP